MSASASTTRFHQTQWNLSLRRVLELTPEEATFLRWSPPWRPCYLRTGIEIDVMEPAWAAFDATAHSAA
jgi:hypothetical protein